MNCPFRPEIELQPAGIFCTGRPDLLKGAPIGMYHCEDCGEMVIAGLPHPDICSKCYKELIGDFNE